jgi:hypothetical protein
VGGECDHLFARGEKHGGWDMVREGGAETCGRDYKGDCAGWTNYRGVVEGRDRAGWDHCTDIVFRLRWLDMEQPTYHRASYSSVSGSG